MDLKVILILISSLTAVFVWLFFLISNFALLTSKREKEDQFSTGMLASLAQLGASGVFYFIVWHINEHEGLLSIAAHFLLIVPAVFLVYWLVMIILLNIVQSFDK